MIILRSYWTIIAFALAFTACGGPSRPGPLKHHMDESYVSRVPMDQKSSMLGANQAWQSAKLEWQAAKQEHEEANTDIRLAENERKQAALAKSSVKERQKAAEKTGDLTQINDASVMQRVAKLNYQAAEKKVDYMKARRAWKRANVDYAEDIMYMKEAQYELAKARTAQGNNIRPKGVKFEDYQRQAETRSRYAQSTKGKVEQKKAKALALEKEWRKLQKDAEAAERQGSGAPPPTSQLMPMDGAPAGGQ